jgi:1-deoxy-D-xylulose-5-phosphate reductoisomerase
MRTPIALALSWPKRIDAPTKRLNLAALGQLTFEAPDETRFPALAVAREALAAGGAAPAVLNAANEEAVMAFLDKRIGFLDIVGVVSDTLEAAHGLNLMASVDRLDDILAVDAKARRLARGFIENGR